MLDIKFIRENIDLLKEIARHKNIDVDLAKLIKADDQRRKTMQKIDELRAQKNEFSKKIPSLQPTEKSQALRQMKDVDIEQSELEEKLKPIIDQFNELMLNVPQIIDERTPIGRDDSENVEISRAGEIRKFNFLPKSHEQLGKDLDIIDFERGVKVGGARSYVLKGDGARLEAAILKYAQDFIYRKGYTLMSVPVVVNKASLTGTGYLPGAEGEIYRLEKDDKYLAGTSEVAIGAFHANEVLSDIDLPKRYAGISSCFRREAGAYGKDTHGLYRVHQFNKIEQFVICENDVEQSKKMFNELLNNAEEFLQNLNIPYRVMNVCTGDMGKGKYYMNDIECWMPSRDSYGETHSCSALLDFQARRLNLRYKDKDGKIHFCHTLNNTVVATPRILIPILENYQNADGSIDIPEALKPYMDHQDKISKER